MGRVPGAIVASVVEDFGARSTVKLTTFHQIVIGGAAALAAVFALRSAYLFAQLRASRDLALAFGALLLAVAALAYLRRFRARLK